MKNGLATILLSGAVALALTPAASARDRSDGPAADVGTITCQSASQTTQMDISYFEVGTKANPNTGSQSSGAGAGKVTFTPVFEIHVPLDSASTWGQALQTGSRFSSCTISVSGRHGPQNLTFSDLMVISVLSVGERRDDSPLPEYYTDVVFIADPAANPTSVGWDLQTQKTS